MAKNPVCSVTIGEVAQFCGLSTATISRAINSPEKLKPETLQKVQAAFDTLGYQYNSLTASLSKSSSNLIGVVISNLRENTYMHTLEAMPLPQRPPMREARLSAGCPAQEAPLLPCLKWVDRAYPFR